MTAPVGLGVEFNEPVLSVCPIPHNVVGFIGGDLGPRPRYLLWKDGQEITIEAPYYNYENEHDPDDPDSERKLTVKAKQTFAHYLEIIQMHLDDIVFGETNWAYLLQDRWGGFYIRQKEKIFKTISCPLWAPTIWEDEIQFTVWGRPWDRRGIWKGMEVDVLYAWSEEDLLRLNRSMYACRILEDMDLTFEVYGHLLRKDGTVIGLVSQAGKGRMIKSSDRALIYRTISNIQSRGCLYKGCGTNRFMISPEGKVRLLELFCLTQYPQNQSDKLAKHAEVWHWKELDDLFWELKTYGPYGNFRIPPDRFTASPKDLQLIIPPPKLGRPLGGIYLYPSPNFFSTYQIPVWEDFEQIQRERDHVRSLQLRRRGIAVIVDDSETNTERSFANEDRPLNLIATLSLSHRSRRNRSGVVYHPYRANRNGRPNVMARSEDTETTSSIHVVDFSVD
ncbi:hypothetical protein BDZ97DRAFT_2055199 [Flammula alnicola]|nr:hypothetical protein BDZ97DRAFT_2055199 [Flammula alnicola]